MSVKERRDARRGSGKIKGKRSNAELREGTESEKERGHGDIVVDSRRSLDTLVLVPLQSSAAAEARGEPVSDGISACKLLVAVALLPYYWSNGKLGRSREALNVITLCSQCDKPETQCTCEKFCCFCQSQYNIRLAVDGMYYCPDCREACDVRLADKDEH